MPKTVQPALPREFTVTVDHKEVRNEPDAAAVHACTKYISLLQQHQWRVAVLLYYIATTHKIGLVRSTYSQLAEG